MEEVPQVKIKSIHFENFKAFEDVNFDFTIDGKCKNFICTYGPNGTGKTTALDAITIIFSKFEGRQLDHLVALLGKSVRHVDGVRRAIYDEKSDFLITANLECSLGDYQVQVSKKGFIKDHPQEIKDIINSICFYAKYDQELHQFSLARNKWNIFKELFEAVTGFTIEENESLFNASKNSMEADILKKYVVGFMVQKPDEKISHKECSAGERKIIKSFSTLLNKDSSPSIVLIDNAEMHVESGRHINLIESMKKCFPKSQIFATTHSYQISRNFGERNQLYDMRLIKATSLIKSEPWRLYMTDEIKDSISKLKSFVNCKDKKSLIVKGETLIKRCMENQDDKNLVSDCDYFLKEIAGLYVEDILYYYKGDNNKGLNIFN